MLTVTPSRLIMACVAGSRTETYAASTGGLQLASHAQRTRDSAEVLNIIDASQFNSLQGRIVDFTCLARRFGRIVAFSSACAHALNWPPYLASS